MKRYEYIHKNITGVSITDRTLMLNGMGQNGWRVLAKESIAREGEFPKRDLFYIFERELED